MNEEMTKEMTIEEVLRDSVNTLDNLKISMSQIDELGYPISRVSINLKNCIVAIERSKMMPQNGGEVNVEENEPIEIIEPPVNE